jgi:hypothetical protein
LRWKSGDVDFCVEVIGTPGVDSEVDLAIGNDFVRLHFETDSDGGWGSLVTETKPRI